MDPITLDGARRSLTETGFRFTTPATTTTMEFPNVLPPYGGRWPSGTPTNSLPSSFRQFILEQVVVKQREEMARLLLQERALRQELLIKERRIQQLDSRTRYQRQTRELLLKLNMRMGEIENYLGRPQVSYSAQRYAKEEKQWFDEDPPVLTAEQEN